MNAKLAIDTLKMMAWVAFGLGVIGGVGGMLTWREQPTVGIAVGIAIIVQGLFTWSFFFVVALCAEKYLIEPIRESGRPERLRYKAPAPANVTRRRPSPRTSNE